MPNWVDRYLKTMKRNGAFVPVDVHSEHDVTDSVQRFTGLIKKFGDNVQMNWLVENGYLNQKFTALGTLEARSYVSDCIKSAAAVDAKSPEEWLTSYGWEAQPWMDLSGGATPASGDDIRR